MVKLLAKETKWTLLEFRTHCTFLEALISKSDSGPVKVTGSFEKQAPGEHGPKADCFLLITSVNFYHALLPHRNTCSVMFTKQCVVGCSNTVLREGTPENLRTKNKNKLNKKLWVIEAYRGTHRELTKTSIFCYVRRLAKRCSYSSLLRLNEQCHENFAVLGHFCAKIITLRL